MSQLTLKIKHVLNQFELTINHKLPLTGIHGIFGHSGSGKSTLLRTIAGLENTTSGEIAFNEQCLQNSKINIFVKPEKRAIGYLFQQSLLFPHLNVLENLHYAEKRRHRALNNTKEISKIELSDLIVTLNLSPLLKQHVNQLSGGERQKVALARAIINSPTLLLLDEPLSALDRTNKIMMMKLINDVHNQFNIPMLYVSHSLDELQQLAKHLTILERGKMIASGETHQIIHQLNYQNDAVDQPNSIAKQTSLSASIVTKDNGYGLTELRSNCGITLHMPHNHLLPHHVGSNHNNTKEEVRCFILATDVSINLSEPNHCSIVNHFLAKISDITIDQQNVLISLSVNKQLFFANISVYSLEKLKLAIGQAVYIQFKASAVRTS